LPPPGSCRHAAPGPCILSGGREPRPRAQAPRNPAPLSSLVRPSEAKPTMQLPLLFVAALSLAGDAAQNWPQFRGPRGDGKSDATGLPLTWSETKNVVWKTPAHDTG